MRKLFIGPNYFSSFPLTWVPLQPLVFSSMCGSMIGSLTGVHPTPPLRLLVFTILTYSEVFAHQKCVSTSSWPTMSFSAMLSCGGISLLSRGVVRGGWVAGVPTKPSAFSVLPVTSSNLLCLWSMKICKNILVNFALQLNQVRRKEFSWTSHLSFQLMLSGKVKK